MKKKAVMLFDKQIFQNIKCEEFSTLQAIHKYLFEDIYDFAGKLRNVNIAKGNFCFVPIIYMKGIDHSYYYEGYITFKAKEL